MLRVFAAALRRQFHGGLEGSYRRGVQGAGPDIAFLPTAMQYRNRLGTAREQQRPGAGRATDLVPGKRERVRAADGEIDRQLADGLDGVGVEQDPVLVADRRELRDRLHRA